MTKRYGFSTGDFWGSLSASAVILPQSMAFGVALLAGVSAGAFPSVEEACRKTIRITGETKPSKNRRLYDERYPLYRGLYRSLKDDFRSMSELDG